MLTVSALTELVSQAIGRALPSAVTVVGEVSNYSRASSGHLYFTLKDEFSQIRCAMWRPKARNVRFDLQDGLSVVATGTVEVYHQRGQYQLYLSKLAPYGVGPLELAFRQLKDKLEKQGLFDPRVKKPLLPYPFTIAVVTSGVGAALADIVRTLNTRWPVGRVLIYPVQVQGESAAGQISEAIKELNAQGSDLGGVDVIIAGRGGGSLEDLWAFNQEVVTRAIHASNIPVVTGIGHQTDVTIADLAADVSAATPTAAAQQVVPVLAELLAQMQQQYRRLSGQAVRTVSWSTQRLDAVCTRPVFAQPMTRLMRWSQRLDDISAGLDGCLKHRIASLRASLHKAQVRVNTIWPQRLVARSVRRLERCAGRLPVALGALIRHSSGGLDRISWKVALLWPGGQLASQRGGLANTDRLLAKTLVYRKRMVDNQLAGLERQLDQSLNHMLRHQKHQLGSLNQRLEASSYHKVLKRGFSVTRLKPTGKLISASGQAQAGQIISTELRSGLLESQVTRTLGPGDEDETGK